MGGGGGLLLIERKCIITLKFKCVLNSTLFSYASYSQKHADHIIIEKALYFAAFYIGGKTS